MSSAAQQQHARAEEAEYLEEEEEYEVDEEEETDEDDSENEAIVSDYLASTPTGAPRASEQSGPPVGFESRLARFFAFYEPSQLPILDQWLANWIGREGQLMESLIRFHGPEPSLSESVPLSYSSVARSTEANTVQHCRELLLQFFYLYAPERVVEVDTALLAWAGREEELLARLKKQSTLRDFVIRFFHQHCPDRVSEIPLVLKEWFGRETELVKILRRDAPVPSKPPAKYADRPLFGSTAKEDPVPVPFASWRDQLLHFYSVYNPSKANQVDVMLEAYKGQEIALFRKLQKKYAGIDIPPPSSSVPHSSGPSATTKSSLSVLEPMSEKSKKLVKLLCAAWNPGAAPKVAKVLGEFNGSEVQLIQQLVSIGVEEEESDDDLLDAEEVVTAPPPPPAVEPEQPTPEPIEVQPPSESAPPMSDGMRAPVAELLLADGATADDDIMMRLSGDEGRGAVEEKPTTPPTATLTTTTDVDDAPAPPPATEAPPPPRKTQHTVATAQPVVVAPIGKASIGTNTQGIDHRTAIDILFPSHHVSTQTEGSVVLATDPSAPKSLDELEAKLAQGRQRIAEVADTASPCPRSLPDVRSSSAVLDYSTVGTAVAEHAKLGGSEAKRHHSGAAHPDIPSPAVLLAPAPEAALDINSNATAMMNSFLSPAGTKGGASEGSAATSPAPAGSSSSNPHSLSLWLNQHGWGFLYQTFLANDVVLECIPSLSDRDLEAMGVASAPLRLSIMQAARRTIGHV